MTKPDDTCPSVAMYDAWPPGPLGPTYLATYTFDPFYFELQVLPELLRRDAHPIVVFADHSAGFSTARQAAGELRRLGRDYYLFGVNRGHGVFHPKVTYFRGPDVALVGSGNLTGPGWGGNLEVLDTLDGKSAPDATRDVRRFFDQLLGEYAGALASRLLAGRGESEGPSKASAETPPVRFLHTLNGDLWSQVSDELELMAGGQLVLAAPFFDEDQYTVRRILDLASPTTCLVAADGSAPALDRAALTCGRMRLAAKDERHLHAKLLHVESGGQRLIMTGSANFTRAAWQGHNVEAVILRLVDAAAPDAPAFDPASAFEPCAWTEYQPREPESAPKPAPQPWEITRATLADGRLEVECSPPPVDPRFRLMFGEKRESITLEAGPEGIWAGPVAESPATAAVVEVVDADGCCCRSVVHQLDILRHPPAHRRQIAALLAAGGDDVSFHDRIELVRLLFDWTFGSGSRTAHKVGSGGRTADSAHNEDNDRGEMGPTIGIQDALEVTRRTAGIDAQSTSLEWLLRRIADAVAGRQSTALMRMPVSDPGDYEDPEGDGGDGKDDERNAAIRREQEQTIDVEILGATRKLLRSDLIHAPEVRRRFPLVYDGMLRLLCGRLNRLRTQDDDDPDAATTDREITRLTLDLLRTAWQVPIWSYVTMPGILCGDTFACSSTAPTTARIALAKLTANVVAGASDFDADMAWSVLKGIDTRASMIAAESDCEESHPVFTLPPDIDVATHLNEIRAHIVTAETAYDALEPIRRLVRAFEDQPSAAVGPAEEAMVIALCDGPPPHVWRRNWARMRKHYLEYQSWPIGQLLANGSCPNCAVKMPTGLTSKFKSRFAHVVCEQCSAIILPGPLFKSEVNK